MFSFNVSSCVASSIKVCAVGSVRAVASACASAAPRQTRFIVRGRAGSTAGCGSVLPLGPCPSLSSAFARGLQNPRLLFLCVSNL